MSLVIVLGLLFSPFAVANRFTLPFDANDSRLEHLPVIGLTEQEVPVEGGTEGETKTIVVGKGVSAFEDIVRVVGNFLTLVLGSVAIVALFIAGYQLVAAQTAAGEEMQKQKMNVVYIMFGLVIFALGSHFVYNFVFYEQGAYLQNSETSLVVANAAVNEIRRVLNLFLSFSGAGAILMLIIASLRLVINPGSDEQIEKQKKLVAYTAVGIMIIGLSDTVINRIFFAQGGTQGVNVNLLGIELQGLSNYVLGFLGVIVFVSLVISGVMYVIYFGNDDVINQVKSNLRSVIIGSLLAFSAYTIVATLFRTFLSAENGAVISLIQLVISS